MKLRSKKVLSLLLAASMVLGMNTIAFADDVAEVAATEETAEVAASSNGKIDYYEDGMAYNADGWVLTTVEYASNGAKKNARDNVATITNVSDPISWNNFRGTDLIETVLYGDNKEDTYLNNKEKLSVSNDNKSDAYNPKKNVDKLKNANPSRYYDVVKVADGAYLFVGYSLDDGNKMYVAGHDEAVGEGDDPLGYNKIPVREWDGRKVAFNKSGDNNATKSNIDALNVKVALVKYENGTLTELYGASVANAKIDNKAQKKASVAYGGTKFEKANDTEHAALGDLPSFTLKIKLDKSVKKTYAKDLKTALKDKKYFFGIMQRGIAVTDPTRAEIPVETKNDNGNTITTKYYSAYQYEYFIDNPSKHWSYDKDKKLVVIPASANDSETIQKNIVKIYGTDGYSSQDVEEKDIGGLKVSKFTEKKANVVLPVPTSKKGKPGKEATITLKAKKDYELKEGSLAGEKVVYIDFPEDGNYVYANAEPNENGSDLSVFGYKWAFRKSPDKKSKKFRYGIYAANDLGFVFSK